MEFFDIHLLFIYRHLEEIYLQNRCVHPNAFTKSTISLYFQVIIQIKFTVVNRDIIEDLLKNQDPFLDDLQHQFSIQIPQDYTLKQLKGFCLQYLTLQEEEVRLWHGLVAIKQILIGFQKQVVKDQKGRKKLVAGYFVNFDGDFLEKDLSLRLKDIFPKLSTEILLETNKNDVQKEWTIDNPQTPYESYCFYCHSYTRLQIICQCRTIGFCSQACEELEDSKHYQKCPAKITYLESQKQKEFQRLIDKEKAYVKYKQEVEVYIQEQDQKIIEKQEEIQRLKNSDEIRKDNTQLRKQLTTMTEITHNIREFYQDYQAMKEENLLTKQSFVKIQGENAQKIIELRCQEEKYQYLEKKHLSQEIQISHEKLQTSFGNLAKNHELTIQENLLNIEKVKDLEEKLAKTEEELYKNNEIQNEIIQKQGQELETLKYEKIQNENSILELKGVLKEERDTNEKQILQNSTEMKILSASYESSCEQVAKLEKNLSNLQDECKQLEWFTLKIGDIYKENQTLGNETSYQGKEIDQLTQQLNETGDQLKKQEWINTNIEKENIELFMQNKIKDVKIDKLEQVNSLEIKNFVITDKNNFVLKQRLVKKTSQILKDMEEEPDSQ